MITLSTLQSVLDKILYVRSSTPSQRSVLTAITGIDGCGKGYVTARIVDALQLKGVHAVAINVDGWLNLPDRRFDARNPAEHFYLHAIRFEEMFARLILPLRDQRSLRIVVDYAEETATEYQRHVYEFEDVDVIVLEASVTSRAVPNRATKDTVLITWSPIRKCRSQAVRCQRGHLSYRPPRAPEVLEDARLDPGRRSESSLS